MWYKRLAITSTVLVFALVLIGGIVRSTGAGMGCPDWPKCFGKWVPPTEASQLPANYQEIYKDRGYADTQFNAAKTWTEYINRLFGVLTGLFLTATFIASFTYWKTDKIIVILSGLASLMTAFQGWLGAKVVETNLAQYMISVHLFIAILIAGLLIYSTNRASYHNSNFENSPSEINLNRLIIPLAIVAFITGIQIFLGTMVRAEVNSIAKAQNYLDKGMWLSYADHYYPIHKVFSMVTFLANVFLFVFIYRNFQKFRQLLTTGFLILIVLMAQIITGVLMVIFDFFFVAQALHILFGSLTLGLQILILSYIINENIFAEKERSLNFLYS